MHDMNEALIQWAIACHPGPRRERLAAVVKENLMEIPVVSELARFH
jgi:hypothetical protein